MLNNKNYFFILLSKNLEFSTIPTFLCGKKHSIFRNSILLKQEKKLLKAEKNTVTEIENQYIFPLYTAFFGIFGKQDGPKLRQNQSCSR